MKRFILFISIFLFWGFGVFSQSKIDCSNARTQTEMTLCAQEEFSATDKQLNVLYQKVIAKCNPKQRAALIKTQKTWLAYRDEHAEMERGLNEVGSIANMLAYNAKTMTTQSRIKELQALLYQLNL